MKLKYIINFAVIVLILNGISCKEKPTEPPIEEFPPGYQHDIPWPSLADSPWPMNHADPQNTGRSKYKGPLNSNISVIELDGDIETGISIGKNGYYYCLSRNGILEYRDFNNNIIWSSQLAFNLYSTPLLASDGTIYITSYELRTIIAVDSLGIRKWEYNSEFPIYTKSIQIGKDGIIYFFNSAKKLIALKNDGTFLWELYDERFFTSANNKPTFSPDGLFLYCQGITVSILAVDLNEKKVSWTFGNSLMVNSPVVDYEGNIFITIDKRPGNDTANIIGLKNNGSVLWTINIGSQVWNGSTIPAIDKNGNLIFATDTLYSIKTVNGEFNWKVSLGNGNLLSSYIMIDNINNIYFVTQKFYSFSEKGLKLFEIEFPEFARLGGNPSISNNNKIYLPGFRENKIYIIG